MKKLILLLLIISGCASYVVPKPPVASVHASLLTEAQFQATVSQNCVLADGRSVAGSRYAALTGNSNLPDFRGMHLRGKNNGRSDGSEDTQGELALGTFEGSFVKSHNHIWWGVAAGPTVQTYTSAGATTNYPFLGGGANATLPALSGAIGPAPTFALYTSDVVGQALGVGVAAENTVRSIIINWFICIN
jgi:hypothetical protein